MQNDQEFVAASEFNFGEIEAGLASGTLAPWRIDASGTRWFRRGGHAEIHGVPADSMGFINSAAIQASANADAEPTTDDLLAERAELLQQADALLDRVREIDQEIYARADDESTEDYA